jgi:hypothetical protein
MHGAASIPGAAPTRFLHPSRQPRMCAATKDMPTLQRQNKPANENMSWMERARARPISVPSTGRRWAALFDPSFCRPPCQSGLR